MYKQLKRRRCAIHIHVGTCPCMKRQLSFAISQIKSDLFCGTAPLDMKVDNINGEEYPVP